MSADRKGEVPIWVSPSRQGVSVDGKPREMHSYHGFQREVTVSHDGASITVGPMTEDGRLPVSGLFADNPFARVSKDKVVEDAIVFVQPGNIVQFGMPPIAEVRNRFVDVQVLRKAQAFK